MYNYETTYADSFASTTNNSTKYATKYNNTNDLYSGELIYTIGKTGDATKEVFAKKSNHNWFSDYGYFMCNKEPFIYRGGDYGSHDYSGVFSCYKATGSSNLGCGYRIIFVI